jgi:hypothetical protein
MNAELDELELRIRRNLDKNSLIPKRSRIEDPDRKGWIRALKKVLKVIHEIKCRK